MSEINIINGHCDANGFLQNSEFLFGKGDYHKALQNAKAALQIEDRNINACIIAGRSATKLKRFEESYNFYRDGLTIDPKNKIITEELIDLQKILLDHFDKMSLEAEEQDYNAVHLCSQEVYPGDQELFLLEKEILEKKYKVDSCLHSTIVDPIKKKEAAKSLMNAHTNMLAGNTDAAIRQCTIALDADPLNIAARQLRAQLDQEKGNIEKSVQDVMAIPKTNRSVDIWKFGGILLHQLGLPIHAEFWYRKATSLSQMKDIEAAMLFQKVRVERIYGPLTIDYPIKVDFTKYGRSIFATKSMNKGEIAFEDKPVILGKLLQFKDISACDHCAASLLTPTEYFGDKYAEFNPALRSLIQEKWPKDDSVKCSSCQREVYCNAQCQKEAWEQYHQLICPNKNVHARALYDLHDNAGYGSNKDGIKEEIWVPQYSPILLARMWAMIVMEAKRLMRQSGLTQPAVEHWAMAKMPLRKFIVFGKTSVASKMPEVFNMMRSIFSDCGDGVKYEITEEEFNARYYQATCNLQSYSSSLSTPVHVFLKNLNEVEGVATMLLLQHIKEEPKVATFAGMFPLHASLNHACDNNVEIIDGLVDGRPGVYVRVFRDVKAGEEIFTTYIDTTMPRKIRRAWLFKSFNFWCQCRRCQFEGDGPNICTNCGKYAQEDRKFPHCGKCQKAWYCTVLCQKEAWVKGHKVICQLQHSKVNPKAIKTDLQDR
ncbi:hypothetical protein CHS0354_042911 [Potamilus streckersoni]|uniref:SET and MYND domain-containing protein 5 n=1 Tax=Potamilus streckersoni TaxID=2493646 RepID=A0AAE0W8A1_9BIVA|nr:hypothetical protein CHS0354_042911 [Potamilus streckersoni]